MLGTDSFECACASGSEAASRILHFPAASLAAHDTLVGRQDVCKESKTPEEHGGSAATGMAVPAGGKTRQNARGRGEDVAHGKAEAGGKIGALKGAGTNVYFAQQLADQGLRIDCYIRV